MNRLLLLALLVLAALSQIALSFVRAASLPAPPSLHTALEPAGARAADAAAMTPDGAGVTHLLVQETGLWPPSLRVPVGRSLLLEVENRSSRPCLVMVRGTDGRLTHRLGPLAARKAQMFPLEISPGTFQIAVPARPLEAHMVVEGPVSDSTPAGSAEARR